MSNYTRTYATYTAWSLATTFISGALFYLVRVVLYQRLSTEAYAEFYSGMAFVLLLHPFLSLGFDPGLAPHLTRWREDGAWGKARSVILTAGAIQIGLGIIVWIVLWFAAAQLGPRIATGADPTFIRVLGAYVIAVLLYKLAITSLLGFTNIALKNIVEMLRVAICAGAIFFLVGSESASTLPAFAYIGATFIAAVLGLGTLFARNGDLRSSGEADPRAALTVIRSGVFATVAFGGVLVFSQLDTVMLNVLRPGDAPAVAAYQVAVPTFMILQSVLLALANNFIPVSAALDHRGDAKRLGRAIARAYEGGAAIVLPAAAIMAALADPIIQFLFRQDVGQAPFALQLLALSAVFIYIAYFNLHALTGLDRTRSAALAIAIAVASNVVLNAMLIPQWSLYGAAAATLGAYIIAAVLTTIALRRRVPLRGSAARVAGVILVSALCYGGAYSLGVAESAGTVSRLTAVGAGGGVYVCGLAVLVFAKVLPGKELMRSRPER